MTLVEEYINQNKWREWDRYLSRLPLNKNQVVYDLGCSIGSVSRLFAPRVKKVVGIDCNRTLLEEAQKNKPDNCDFLLENLSSLKPQSVESCDGIWMSYTLAYIKNPESFISDWVECLNPGGWFAVVDIDGLLSSHLPENSRFYKKIDAFESEQEQSGEYDFRVGKKIRRLFEINGLEIVVAEENWYDRELNFNHKSVPEIVLSWEARMSRMITLKSYFGNQYADFCAYFLNLLQQESHVSIGAVKYYVGVKNRNNDPFNR